MDGGWLEDMLGNKKEVASWTGIFESTYQGEIDTWDYQWVFANWLEGRINVVPNVNLISNIGFGREDATHTTGNSVEANMPIYPIKFPLKHPNGTIRNIVGDDFEYRKSLNPTPTLFKRIYNKVLRIFRVNKKTQLLE